MSHELRLDYLYRLTDSTGILPRLPSASDRSPLAYRLADNARALVVAIRAHLLTGDNGLLDYIRHYLAVIERCQLPNGGFRRDESLEESYAIWALGFAAWRARQTEVRLRALACLDRALPSLTSTPRRAGEPAEISDSPALPRLTSSVAAASEPSGPYSELVNLGLTLVGLRSWHVAEPSAELATLAQLKARLMRSHEAAASALGQASQQDWLWFASIVGPGSAWLPLALLESPDAELAIRSLGWLCEQLFPNGWLSLPGTNGWFPKEGPRAVYDQLPSEAAALVSACAAAFDVSGEPRFRQWAELGCAWFEGWNIAQQSLVDPATGSCADAIGENGISRGRGADALLSWLLVQEEMSERGWR